MTEHVGVQRAALYLFDHPPVSQLLSAGNALGEWAFGHRPDCALREGFQGHALKIRAADSVRCGNPEPAKLCWLRRLASPVPTYGIRQMCIETRARTLLDHDVAAGDGKAAYLEGIRWRCCRGWRLIASQLPHQGKDDVGIGALVVLL